MANSLYNIEASFSEKFTGKKLKDVDGRDNYVPVFVDYPDLQDAPERRFPSISILLIGLTPEQELYDSEQIYDVSYDYTQTPTLVKTRRMPEFYRIVYEVSCYSLSAFEDRELLRWCESRFTPRDFINVGSEAYHVFRSTFTSEDAVDFDTVVYKKTWTFEILADIEDTDNDIDYSMVEEIRVKSNIQNKVRTDGVDTVEKKLHRVVVFDDQKYWFK